MPMMMMIRLTMVVVMGLPPVTMSMMKLMMSMVLRMFLLLTMRIASKIL